VDDEIITGIANCGILMVQECFICDDSIAGIANRGILMV
jgi:hypothetical protein